MRANTNTLILCMATTMIGAALATARLLRSCGKCTEGICRLPAYDAPNEGEAEESGAHMAPHISTHMNPHMTMTSAALDLPEGMVLPGCPDNQRFVFTLPSSHYESLNDGRLHASDIVSGYDTLLEMEFRSYHLSVAEKGVARCLLANDPNQRIGETLFISESTVKYHVRNIFKKTNCANRNAFARAIHEGIARSTHSWRSRRELERDMEVLDVPRTRINTA